MIEIKYNPRVIAKLREHGFYPDTMFTALFAMQCVAAGDITLLDLVDDYSSSKRMILVYYDLVRKGFFVETKDDGKTYFELTDKGRSFLAELVALEADTPVKDDTHDWISEWLDLFPVGVKSGGKLLRSDAKSCLMKMRTFRKKYGYDRDTIMAATRKYLAEKKAHNWEFTRCAVYFIDKKGEGSDLAAECSQLHLKSPEARREEVFQSVIANNLTGLV